MRLLSSITLLFLLIFMMGCSGLEKLPDSKIEQISTRTIEAPLDKVYDSAIATLLDEGYTIQSESSSKQYLNTGWKDLAGHDPVESMAGQLNTRVILNFSDKDGKTVVYYKLFARNISRNSGDGSRVKVTFLEKRVNDFFKTLETKLSINTN